MSKHYKMLFVGLSIIALMLACGDQNPKVQSANPWSDSNRQQQSNPELSILSMYGTDGPATGICLADNLCFVTDAIGGLTIYNVADPAEPTLVSEFAIPNAYRVSVFDYYAFVTGNFNGVKILGISHPDMPELFTTYGTSPAGNPFKVGDLLYVPINNSLEILDMRNPVNPTLLGKFDLTATPWDVYVRDQYAGLAMGDNGCLIVDVSDPQNISQVSYLSLPGVASEIAVKDSYIYVACQEAGLQIIDASNIQEPSLKGQFSTPSSVYGVSVQGNYAYLATDSPGMMVVNISDALNPTFVKVWANTESSRDVAASGNFVFLADQAKGLIVMKFKY
jgi:hypothetical protein